MPTYSTNLSDSQWQVIKQYLNVARKRSYDLRDVVNAIFYLVKTGCQWRLLPRCFPKWELVYYYFNSWKHKGIIRKIHQEVAKQLRVKKGKNAEPTVGIIDSQSVKSTLVSAANQTGYDAGKKIKGIKRPIVTDILGIMLCVVIHSASIQDRDGAILALTRLQRYWHNIIKVFADGGYSGKLIDKVQHTFGYILEIVKRTELSTFKVLPKRWIVERTFSWLDTNRRNSKFYERHTSTAEAMTQLASLRRMMIHFDDTKRTLNIP